MLPASPLCDGVGVATAIISVYPSGRTGDQAGAPQLAWPIQGGSRLLYTKYDHRGLLSKYHDVGAPQASNEVAC